LNQDTLVSLPGREAPPTPEEIKRARKILGLSQPDFALYIGRLQRRGVRPSSFTVGRWERGVKVPGPLYLMGLRAAIRLANERLADYERGHPTRRQELD
jgi:DNA-binding transcriptional regulator YiaG